ncbi:MFS general substrate transporter [Whalleya microplaca]|nr:MFS general substrate transporter [Whalleya microplaca]
MPSRPTPPRTTAAQAITGSATPKDTPSEASISAATSIYNDHKNEPNSSLTSDVGTAPGSPDQTTVTTVVADAHVPDGGYGWAVVAGCATLTFWFGGTTYSWGVMQAALVNQGLASASTLAFVGSTTVASIAAFALINARIVRLLGARTTGLLGVFLMGIGETAASFTTHSIGGMFGTESILMGVGVSMCFMVSSITPAQYFKKRRGLANGIVYAGGGLGGTGIAFVMDAINQKLSTEWTFRIIGLSMLATGLPMAFLIKDRGGPPPVRAWVEWALFKDYRFVTLFLCGLIATFPLFVPVFFVPLYAESFGIPSLGGAGLVAAFQFASFFGRLGGGALADVLGALNTLISSLLFNVLSMLLIWPFSTSIGPLVVFVIINGAANGTFFATMPTVVANIFGSARVSVAMGMVVTAWTGGYLLGSPIAGYILSATGSNKDVHNYRPSIFYASGLSVLALILGLMTRFRISRRVAYKV